MIVIVATYCGIIILKLANSQSRKLAALDERPMQLEKCNVLLTEKSNIKRGCVQMHSIFTNDIFDASTKSLHKRSTHEDYKKQIMFIKHRS